MSEPQIVRETQTMTGLSKATWDGRDYHHPSPIFEPLYYWDDGIVTWTKDRK